MLAKRQGRSRSTSAQITGHNHVTVGQALSPLSDTPGVGLPGRGRIDTLTVRRVCSCRGSVQHGETAGGDGRRRFQELGETEGVVAEGDEEKEERVAANGRDG